MNPEQFSNQVEEAIKTHPHPDSKKFWLCLTNGEFRCLPQVPATGSDSIICELTAEDCAKGPSLKKWARIVNKVAKLMENAK